MLWRTEGGGSLMRQRILKRERIDAQLGHIFDYSLTVVVAAMGYGKTTSVRSFLDARNALYVWLSIESDETSAQYIWDSLTRQLAKADAKLGNQLHALGFPVDAPQRDRIMDIIGDCVHMPHTILVIDDYHFARSPELDRLIERIVRAEIEGLHIVIISRTKPEIHVDELQLKGYCHLFRSDLFEMSPEEIEAYFKLFGQEISANVARRVHVISEGWITVVYLIIQRYCEIGRLEPGANIESLIETAIMSRYGPEEAQVLTSLCILDSFTPQQAKYVTENKATAAILQKLSVSNSLIRFDERTGCYKMHSIFSGYLRKQLEARSNRIELRRLYRRSGEWFIENGELLLGLRFLLHAGEYDLFLAQFEKPGITKVIDRAGRSIVELFEQIPDQAKYRHPKAYLIYADFYLTNVDRAGGARLLDQIERHYRNVTGIPAAQKRRIAGEIELSRSFLFFNDLRKMHHCQLKAYQLLDGEANVANKDMIFTFGSPHVLYLYHREKGALQWIVEYVGSVFHYYREVSGGCGTGFEYLAQAEYFLETGNFVGAEYFAHKAIYKAQTMQQVSVIVCAYLTLARLKMAQGRFIEAKELVDNLDAEVSEYNSPILNSAVNLCTGYIAGIMGKPQSFAEWLKSGDIKQSEILYQGMAFNYIVYAKSLLLAKNYVKIEVLCEDMHQLFAKFSNLFGYIHLHILDAVAKYQLYGMEKAKEALKPALDIGRADEIVLPFAEYGLYILDILRALQDEKGDDVYLNKLITGAVSYCNNLTMLADQMPDSDLLSEREKEVLRLVAAGKTNREIAAGLYLAEVTVRKNITSIYRKLGVEGRASAVKKAVESRLTE